MKEGGPRRGTGGSQPSRVDRPPKGWLDASPRPGSDLVVRVGNVAVVDGAAARATPLRAVLEVGDSGSVVAHPDVVLHSVAIGILLLPGPASLLRFVDKDDGLPLRVGPEEHRDVTNPRDIDRVGTLGQGRTCEGIQSCHECEESSSHGRAFR